MGHIIVDLFVGVMVLSCLVFFIALVPMCRDSDVSKVWEKIFAWSGGVLMVSANSLIYILFFLYALGEL